MTLRRRFFPATKTQAVPGKTVELSARLRPTGKSTAAAPTSTVPIPTVGVMLLPDFVPGLDLSPEFEFQAQVGLLYGWLLRPEFDAWRLIGGYACIESPWQTGGGIVTLRAIALADSRDVVWTWTLDVPPLPGDGSYGVWWDGVELDVQDGTLKITVLPGEYYGSARWWATLTCIASSSDTELGRIVLRPGFGLNDLVNLPLPSSI